MGKITENKEKNGAQRCLASRNGSQFLQKITRRPFFGRSYQRDSTRHFDQFAGICRRTLMNINRWKTRNFDQVMTFLPQFDLQPGGTWGNCKKRSYFLGLQVFEENLLWKCRSPQQFAGTARRPLIKMSWLKPRSLYVCIIILLQCTLQLGWTCGTTQP